MCDEMLIAEAEWLPQYAEEMRANKEEARKNAAETDKAKERPAAE